MKPLILLLSVFFIGILIKKSFKKTSKSTQFFAQLAMSCMLVFTGIAHFAFTKGMAAMLPDWMPIKMEIVYATGIFELLAAVTLLTKNYARITGILLIIFFIGVLPANILAALHNINPLTGATDGPGWQYVFFRIPLQLFYIVWIYFSTLKTLKP